MSVLSPGNQFNFLYQQCLSSLGERCFTSVLGPEKAAKLGYEPHLDQVSLLLEVYDEFKEKGVLKEKGRTFSNTAFNHEEASVKDKINWIFEYHIHLQYRLSGLDEFDVPPGCKLSKQDEGVKQLVERACVNIVSSYQETRGRALDFYTSNGGLIDHLSASSNSDKFHRDLEELERVNPKAATLISFFIREQLASQKLNQPLQGFNGLTEESDVDSKENFSSSPLTRSEARVDIGACSMLDSSSSSRSSRSEAEVSMPVSFSSSSVSRNSKEGATRVRRKMEGFSEKLSSRVTVGSRGGSRLTLGASRKGSMKSEQDQRFEKKEMFFEREEGKGKEPVKFSIKSAPPALASSSLSQKSQIVKTKDLNAEKPKPDVGLNKIEEALLDETKAELLIEDFTEIPSQVDFDIEPLRDMYSILDSLDS